MFKRRARGPITRTQIEVSSAHSLKTYGKTDLVENSNPLYSSGCAMTQARKEAFRRKSKPYMANVILGGDGPRDARLGLADRSHCQIFEWKEDLEAGTVGQENQ